MVSVGETIRDIGIRKIACSNYGKQISASFAKAYDYLYTQSIGKIVVMWKKGYVRGCKKVKINLRPGGRSYVTIPNLTHTGNLYVTETEKAFVLTPIEKEKTKPDDSKIRYDKNGYILLTPEQRKMFGKFVKLTFDCNNDCITIENGTETKYNIKEINLLLKSRGIAEVNLRKQFYVPSVFGKKYLMKRGTCYDYEVGNGYIKVLLEKPSLPPFEIEGVGETLRSIGERKLTHNKNKLQLAASYAKGYSCLYEQCTGDYIVLWKKEHESAKKKKIYSNNTIHIDVPYPKVNVFETENAFVLVPSFADEQEGISVRIRDILLKKEQRKILGNGPVKCTYYCSDKLGYQIELEPAEKIEYTYWMQHASDVLEETGTITNYLERIKSSLFPPQYFLDACELKPGSYIPFEVKDNKLIILCKRIKVRPVRK